MPRDYQYKTAVHKDKTDRSLQKKICREENIYGGKRSGLKQRQMVHEFIMLRVLWTTIHYEREKNPNYLKLSSDCFRQIYLVGDDLQCYFVLSLVPLDCFQRIVAISGDTFIN